MKHVRVLVVGAGPVGLALAGDLGWRGVECLLVERSDGTITQPRMDMVGIRTMEFARRWGIVDWVESSPYPRDYPQDNVYVSSLTGVEFEREPFPSMGDAVNSPESPQRRERCPQDMFDPILTRFARSMPTVDLRYNLEVTGVEPDDDLVTVSVRDRLTGQSETITADYVIGCDGGDSFVRTALSIERSGAPALTFTTNVIFRCSDLINQHDKGCAYRFICIGPEGTYATIVAINGNDRWRLSIIGDDDPHRPDAEQIDEVIRRAVGADIDYETESVTHWVRAELIADEYRRGRVFIAGDAAHVMSPTGGFGMNTGIGDAVDLAWKLEATMAGWGGPELLDSYEIERRPVAVRNAAEATSNLKNMLQPRSAPPSREALEPGPAGDAARAEFGRWFKSLMGREWFAVGIHLGYRYDGSPICWDEGTAPANPVASYTQSTRPGGRAPHAWLADGRSTLDLFGRGFTLIRAGATAPTGAGLLVEAARQGVPLTRVSVDDPAVLAVYDRALTLVRPDGHVAWRGDVEPSDVAAVLAQARGASAIGRDQLSSVGAAEEQS